MNENDRSVLGFVMVGHTLVHTYELSIPILMTIWLLEFSTSAAVLGVAVAIGYGLFGLGALPGGILVDKYGSRVLISGCLAGMGLSFLALSMAPNVLGVTIALALWGMAASVYHPAGLTLISNAITQRGRGFAYHGMAGNAGIAGGPLVTALLLLVFDWRLVAILLAIPALIVAVIGLLISFDPTAAVEGDAAETSRRIPTTVAAFVGDTRRLFTLGFVLVFGIVTFNGLYYRGMLTFLPELLGTFLSGIIGAEPALFPDNSPLAEQFDLAQYLYAGLLTVGIGGQYLGGRLTDRILPERGLVVMLATLTVIAIIFVPLAASGVAGLLLASVLLGVVLFAMQPLTQATIAKYSLPSSRGLSFGYMYVGIFGIGALGAAIAGTVLTYTSEPVMFLVIASFSAMGGLIALTLATR